MAQPDVSELKRKYQELAEWRVADARARYEDCDLGTECGKIEFDHCVLTGLAKLQLTSEQQIGIAFAEFLKWFPKRKRWQTYDWFRGNFHLFECLISPDVEAIFEEHAATVAAATRFGDALRACRLCIRLTEPEADSEDWIVEVGVVFANDPSVLILHGSTHIAELTPSQRLIVEFAFSAVDDAAETWPPLQQIDDGNGPITATVSEVVDLVQHQATKLRAAGVEIQLPIFLQKQATPRRVVSRYSVRDFNRNEGSRFGADALLSARLDLAVDGEPLTVGELERIARLKQPLVRLRGKWVYFDPSECDPDELKRIVERLLKGAWQTVATGEMVCDVLSGRFDSSSFPVEVTDQRLNDLIDRIVQKSDIPLIDPPKGLVNATLYPYQQVGYSWLCFLSDHELGALLADDMGVGKTVQTLAWLLRAKERQSDKPSLLICPTSVMRNWEREAEKFAPSLLVYEHHGPNRPTDETGFSSRVRRSDVVITTYSLLRQDANLFEGVDWSAIILDEAQNIKNQETEQSRAAVALGKKASFRLALTGTPIENHAGDLWPIMEFLNPGSLGSWSRFEKRFVNPIRNNREQTESARAMLKQLIQPFLLRRRKTDPEIAAVLQLPEKREQTVLCSLTQEQAGWYRAVLKQLEETATSGNRLGTSAVLKVLTELKQTCNHPALLLKDQSVLHERSGKLNRLVEMLEEVLDNDEKALIFTQYAEMANMLNEFLRDHFQVSTDVLSGSCSPNQREAMVKQFQEDPRLPILILSLKAGGVGLNLTAATHVFHYDRWWNPAVEDQATDRAHRIGQTKMVNVHKFVCVGTLEERIAKMLDDKRSLSKELLGEVSDESLAGYLSKLSVDELRSFLRLDDAAICDE